MSVEPIGGSVGEYVGDYEIPDDLRDEDVRFVRNRAPWINIAVGLLVLTLSWPLHPTALVADWNLFGTGLAIVACATLAAVTHGRIVHNYWSALNLIAGSWLLVSPALIPSTPAATWPQACLGVIAIVTASVSLSNEELFRQRALLRVSGYDAMRTARDDAPRNA